MLPYFESFVAKTMSRLLPTLGAYSHIQRLNVDGLLDPREVAAGQYSTIRHLSLNSILVGQGLEGSLADFLSSFPMLTNLEIRTSPLGPLYNQRLPLHKLQWPDLQFCDITGTLVPENELFAFTERHALKRLTLKQITLTSGSWKSFFSRVRKLQPRPSILCFGVLTAKGSPPWHGKDSESQRLLDCFLAHIDFPWPFSDPDDLPVFAVSP